MTASCRPTGWSPEINAPTDMASRIYGSGIGKSCISSNFGVGIEFDVGTEILAIEIRGNTGFSNTRSVDPAFHNQSFGLFAGILF